VEETAANSVVVAAGAYTGAEVEAQILASAEVGVEAAASSIWKRVLIRLLLWATDMNLVDCNMTLLRLWGLVNGIM
jgi:hypothetical protein